MADLSVIVADAGPLIALAKLDRIGLLCGFFGEVFVPDAVARECTTDLSRPDAQTIQEAIGQAPFRVIMIDETERLRAYSRLLDPGEAQALTLAEQRGLPVLIDERKGRQEAQRLGIEIIGTGALIVAAKRRGLVTEVRPLLISLVREGYRLSDRLVQALLEMSGAA